MIDAVSMLLLIAADPGEASLRVIKVAPALQEALEEEKESGPVTGEAPEPEILDSTLGFMPDDYPAESLQAGEEGSVRIALEVDAEGKQTGCTVILSSGHSRLDERTCQVAMERAAFQPARDAEGKAIASVWRSRPVVWRIPKSGHGSFPPGVSWHATTIQIAADGTIGECTTETSGNFTVPNACEQAKARHAEGAKDAARWWKSLTYVIATSDKDTPPDVGRSEWGMRQARLLSAQLSLDGTTTIVSCETLLSEGWSFGGTACPPADVFKPIPADADWSKARTQFFELSTFGQPR